MARPKKVDEITIIKKAADLFHLRGYSGISTQELIDELGISKSSLYFAFRDKKDIFIKSLKFYQSNSIKKFENSFDNELSFREQIGNLMHDLADRNIDDCSCRGCFMLNTAVELANNDSEIKELVIANNARAIEIIQSGIIKAIDKGEISKESDSESMARYFFNVIQGMNVEARVHQDERVYNSIVDYSLKILD